MELPVIQNPDAPDANPSAIGCMTTNTFEPSRRLPPWLKREVPKGNENRFTSGILDELRLETVCENAKCPNRMECYAQKTATFMILGNVCTRPCGFCAVQRGKPDELELDEPSPALPSSRLSVQSTSPSVLAASSSSTMPLPNIRLNRASMVIDKTGSFSILFFVEI